jgi:methionine-rich copper-binding protein CopC
MVMCGLSRTCLGGDIQGRRVSAVIDGRSLNLRRVAIVFTFLLLFTGLASAHAILLKSTPAVNAMVAGPDFPLILTFNSKVDQKRSTLILERPDHSTAKLRIDDDSASAATLNAQLSNLTPGPYVVRWQVLAVDGHITRGEIRFKVK